jgi:hypothetical protein
VDRRLHSDIGRALAREALRVLPPGGQITVITRDTAAFPQPALDILLRSFLQEIHREADVAVATHALQLDPLRPVEVPPGDFYELIRRSNTGRVIVSLLGPPVLTSEQRAALGTVKPKVIAFCSGHLAQALDLDALFRAGLLQAALVARPAPSVPASGPAGEAGAFERLYTVVRAEPARVPEPSQAGQ